MDSRAILESRYNGPIPKRDRMAMNFGSREAFERAERNAAIRYHRQEVERACRVLRPMTADDPRRESETKILREHFNAWRDLVRAPRKATQQAAE